MAYSEIISIRNNLTSAHTVELKHHVQEIVCLDLALSLLIFSLERLNTYNPIFQSPL